MLPVISGLPGTGKSAVAAALAARTCAVHLSIDNVEDALLGVGLERGWMTDVAAYEMVRVAAEQNLRLGRFVVVDAVNDSEPARDTWRRAALATGTSLRFVVLTPPDPSEHRRRLEKRSRDLLHVPEPTWEQVFQARSAAYEPWVEEPFLVDAGQELDAVVERVLRSFRRTVSCRSPGSAEDGPTVRAVRKQYHFRPSASGLHAWDVDRLIALADSLPEQAVPLHEVSEIEGTYWFDHGYEPTVRAVVDHVRLVIDADLSYPIILDPDGRVMDGMHRVAKALLLGHSMIAAKRLHTLPDPDYTDVQSDELPYGE